MRPTINTLILVFCLFVCFVCFFFVCFFAEGGDSCMDRFSLGIIAVVHFKILFSETVTTIIIATNFRNVAHHPACMFLQTIAFLKSFNVYMCSLIWLSARTFAVPCRTWPSAVCKERFLRKTQLKRINARFRGKVSTISPDNFNRSGNFQNFSEFFYLFSGYLFVFEIYDFLALLCATAQQSYCRHAGVRRPSVVRPSVRP